MELTAIILAGGKSSRMGQDKGLILYRGKPLIQYAIETCSRLTSGIIISTGNPDYAAFGFPLIRDNFSEVGPLGGLEAALTCSSTEDNFFCPCDMPYLDSILLDNILQKKKGNLAVVAEDLTGKLFPVVGYYSKSALPVIRQQIEAGDYKMISLLNRLGAETVPVTAEGWSSNFNTREDML